MTDSFEMGRVEVAEFYKQYGPTSEAVLRAFNVYDFLELNPNGGDVPADEYLSYAKKFMEVFSRVEEKEKTEAHIAIILFNCFAPEQFLGIYKVTRGEIAEYIYATLGECPDVTPKDVIAIAKLIFKEIKKLNIRVIVENREVVAAQ